MKEAKSYAEKEAEPIIKNSRKACEKIRHTNRDALQDVADLIAKRLSNGNS